LLIKRIAGGIASYVPGFNTLRGSRTGGSSSARYCYGVWFRHLLTARRYGLAGVPPRVGELGPGDSLGTGLAALLSGAERYVALDRTVYASTQGNLAVLDELVKMFGERADIPGGDELPDVWPRIPRAPFPRDLLDDATMERLLAPERLARIRDAIADPRRTDAPVRYVAPWNQVDNVVGEALDFVFSQAVAEHVDDVRGTHRGVHEWLRPGGIASHTVDFGCHGLDPRWNAHWTYSPLVWTLIQGRRPWRLNREPCSRHERALADAGFEVLAVIRRSVPTAIRRDQLTKEFVGLDDTDLTTDSALLVARRR